MSTTVTNSNNNNYSCFVGTMKGCIGADCLWCRCEVDLRTLIDENGVGKGSRFNFEAFRFVQHRDQDKSSIYLHCIVRLCEPTKCQDLLNVSRPLRQLSDMYACLPALYIHLSTCSPVCTVRLPTCKPAHQQAHIYLHLFAETL